MLDGVLRPGGPVTLADAYRALVRREMSAVELTQACLDRVKGGQDAVNAFIWIDAEAAMEAARISDARRSAGNSRSPLDGIPMAHKDMFAMNGRRSTCGSEILRDHHPRETATAVARLEAAGAVTLGGLNMAEFAQGPTGHNAHYGACRNPWNPAYISGGSSSGSGAAVAAGMVYGSLGSDTGGSIRIPASCCGVTGLKPTYGRVSRHGAMPLSYSMDCIGPLARSAEDCALIMSTIAGADPCDLSSSGRAVPSYAAALTGDLAATRIGVPRQWFFDGVDEPVLQAFATALEILAARGASIVSVDLAAMDAVSAYSAVVSRVELAAVHAEWMRTRSDAYAVNVSGRMYPGYAIPGVHYVEALRRRGAVLAAFCNSVFKEIDIIASPTLPRIVPTLDETDIEAGTEEAVRRFLSPSQNTRPFSYLGLPALSVPCGIDINGLPVGLQLAGRPFSEARLLRVGDSYQRDSVWHRLPARYGNPRTLTSDKNHRDINDRGGIG